MHTHTITIFDASTAFGIPNRYDDREGKKNTNTTRDNELQKILKQQQHKHGLFGIGKGGEHNQYVAKNNKL